MFSSIFNSGANILGSLLSADEMRQMQTQTNNVNLKIARETNAQNLKLAREQNDWNYRQWLRTNAYNDPANQFKRFKAAGLSSAAAAQAVSGVPAQPMQSADLSVMAQPPAMQAPPATAWPNIDLNLDFVALKRQLQALKQDEITTDNMEQENKYTPLRLFTNQQLAEYNLMQAEQVFKEQQETWPYRKTTQKRQTAKALEELLQSRLEKRIMRWNLKSARQNFKTLESLSDTQLKKAFAELDIVFQELENKKKEGVILDQNIATNAVKKAFDKYGGVPDNFAARMAILILEGVIKPSDIDKNIANFTEILNYCREGLISVISDSAADIMYKWQHRNDNEKTPNLGLRSSRKRNSKLPDVPTSIER